MSRYFWAAFIIQVDLWVDFSESSSITDTVILNINSYLSFVSLSYIVSEIMLYVICKFMLILGIQSKYLD